jgi:hypothetical protein
MTYSKYAEKNQYLEVHSRVKLAEILVIRKQRTGAEDLSKPLGISVPYKACFVRSDFKRDNKEVY